MSGKVIEGSNISVSKGLVHYDIADKKGSEDHPNIGGDFEDHEHSHGEIELYRVFSIIDSTNKVIN